MSLRLNRPSAGHRYKRDLAITRPARVTGLNDGLNGVLGSVTAVDFKGNAALRGSHDLDRWNKLEKVCEE